MTAAPPSMPPFEPRMRGSRLPIVVALVAVAAIVGGVAASQGWFGGSPGASAAPSSSVAGVIPQDSTVVAEGRAVPVAWSEVRAAGSGRISAIPAAVGDAVAAGDVLVRLDDEAAAIDVRTATAAQAGARAGAERAEAAVAQARAGVDQAQAGLDQAQAGADQARAARQGAVAALGAAQAALRAADAARDALPGTATRAQERQADAQVSQAAAGVTQAAAGVGQAAAGVAQAAAGVDAARAQVASARAALRSAQAARDAAAADEERAALALAGAQLARERLAITSPIAGTVVSIDPAVGDLIGPTSGIVARVADTSAWRFETSDLSETSIARVEVGSAARITVDGLPGAEIAGTVESVGGYGASVQGDIVFTVVVVPTGELPAKLRWNMTVTIEIDRDTAG